MKDEKVVMMGLGYIGLPTAALIAPNWHKSSWSRCQSENCRHYQCR